MDYLKKQAHEIDISDKGLQREIGYKIKKLFTKTFPRSGNYILVRFYKTIKR